MAKQYRRTINGVQERKRFSDIKLARAWQGEAERLNERARAGLEDPIAACLLEVHAAEFIRGRQTKASFRHDAFRMKTYVIDRFLAHEKFGKKPRERELHRLKIQDWLPLFGEQGELIVKHGLSPATHNRIRTLVHTMYEHARRQFTPPRALQNPITDIPPLEEAPGPIQWLRTGDEIQRYLAAAHADTVQPAFGIFATISLSTGLREGNVIGLRWSDIDFSTDLIHVRLKWDYASKSFVEGAKGTDETRMLGMGPALKESLLAWRRAAPPASGDDFICRSPEGGHLTVQMVYRANQRALKRAGLGYIKPHALRHTYGTQYVDQGGNIHDLKEQLGHSSVTVTEQFYVHTAPHRLKARAKVFEVKLEKSAEVVQLKKRGES